MIDKLYCGVNNSLVLETEETLTFMCYFNLEMYPFDQQICSLTFKMQDLTDEFGVFYKVKSPLCLLCTFC